MNEKYQRMLDHGIEVMNKFQSDSEEYELGRKLVAQACERNREEQKVKTFFPATIGTMAEKMEKQAEEIYLE